MPVYYTLKKTHQQHHPSSPGSIILLPWSLWRSMQSQWRWQSWRPSTRSACRGLPSHPVTFKQNVHTTLPRATTGMNVETFKNHNNLLSGQVNLTFFFLLYDFYFVGVLKHLKIYQDVFSIFRNSWFPDGNFLPCNYEKHIPDTNWTGTFVKSKDCPSVDK